jgi:hypothetical protein
MLIQEQKEELVNMKWEEILKANPINRFVPEMKKMLEKGGNVIMRAIPLQEKTNFNNGTLTMGKDVIGDSDPKKYIKGLMQILPNMGFGDRFSFKESSISGEPSLILSLSKKEQQRQSKPDWDY